MLGPFISALGAGVVALSVATSAQAVSVFSFQEVGNDVVGTLTGSLILPSDGVRGFISHIGSAQSSSAAIFAFQTKDILQTLYHVTGPSSFGSGGAAFATSAVDPDEAIFLSSNSLFLSRDYVSGTAMDGMITFANQSFASLGVTRGDYVWTLSNNDTFTLRYGAVPVPSVEDTTAIPLPAGLPLLAGGLGMLGLMLLRRRRA